jgi:anti-anti-sigma factor
MALLDVTVRQDGRWCLVSVTGEMDLGSVEIFDRAVAEVLADEVARHLVVDLTHVAFLSSVGLRSLMTARDRVLPDGAFRVVAPPGAAARRVLQISGLDGYLAPYPTVPAAIAEHLYTGQQRE